MLSLALLLSATLALPAEIRDTCGSFDVHLKSASGDAMEDDMSVTLVFADGRSLPVPLPPALYEPRGTLKNVTNLCAQLAAFDAGGNRVLLLLSRNGRPQWDILDAVLIDAQHKRVLDVKTGVGEIKTEDRVIVARSAGAASFDVLLIREEVENSGCDCAAASIEDWMRIALRGERIHARWARAERSAGILPAGTPASSRHPPTIEIPFRWTPGQIEIQVSINGRDPIWCILDSGAEFSMLDRETAKTLGLAPTHEQQIENLTLDIGPLRLPRQTVTLWALDNFRRQNRNIRGVIGCAFERYVVTIDYQRHVVILIKPSTFRPRSSATSFPVTFSGRLPVIKANLKFAGRSISSRLMVDTGASQAVILRYPFAVEHRLFGSSDARTTSETAATGRRTFITLSAEELELGRWKFPNPAVKAYGSQDGAGGYTSSDGLLGNDVLRHFRVTFDYSRKRMFL